MAKVFILFQNYGFYPKNEIIKFMFVSCRKQQHLLLDKYQLLLCIYRYCKIRKSLIKHPIFVAVIKLDLLNNKE